MFESADGEFGEMILMLATRSSRRQTSPVAVAERLNVIVLELLVDLDVKDFDPCGGLVPLNETDDVRRGLCRIAAWDERLECC